MKNIVGGNGSGLLHGTLTKFAWKDREKPQKTSVKIESFGIEIQSRECLNMKADYTTMKLG
jgi:hypothetical protein